MWTTSRSSIQKYVNIGVAVDTEFGLLVPVLRDVDQKNIIQISAELAQLADKAKARKLTLEDMEGGCFTVSNLGGIGGTYFTPIVNVPEVAILGMSRSVVEPVHINGEFQPRTMMPLSLSVRPPAHRRCRCHPLLALGLRCARAAVRDGAPRVNTESMQ